jgi:hypothetical protein
VTSGARVDGAARDWFSEWGRLNLLILSGPQNGKTTAARWMLCQLVEQDVRTGYATYSHEQARHIAGLIERDHGGRLKWSGGVGRTAMGGAPLDALIIDDPVRDEAAAVSAAHLDQQWQWWLTVARCRMTPAGRVCTVMTQWRGDDFGGMIQRDEPDDWTVVGSMPRQMLAKVRPSPT